MRTIILHIQRIKQYIWMLPVLICVGCSHNTVYEKSYTVKDYTWSKDSSFAFDIPILETTKAYTVFCIVRNNGDYPYSNLHLFVQTTAPGGQTRRDTSNFVLADQHGKWTGSGWGNIWSNSFVFKANITFPTQGIYKIFLTQGMREVSLKGITDVGIKIEEFHPETK